MKASEFRKLIREEVYKAMTEASSGATANIAIHPTFARAVKNYIKGHQQDAEDGETYYVITPGKEIELLSVLFSQWVKTSLESAGEYQIIDDLDNDLDLSNPRGMAAVLTKKGLLTKKVR